ncbi:MAG TPA: hypothetical protein VKZ53_30575, partial [Candidatus Angelobacter sp.]|nr:hypothetical protein [Candidatus Angelobacter sp.]
MHITSIVKRSHLILCLTLLASYCVPQLSAQSTVPNGNGSSNQIAVQGAFDQHRTFPETSNGYLFSFVRAPQPGAANIILNSVDTGARTEVTFALDGANSLQIEGVTVSPNQHLLVAGVLTRSDNGAKETFLAAADFSGNIIWRFNLGMYLPQRLCGASDGTVWVLGQDMKKEIAKGNKGDYDLLRAYSGDGQLQHSYLSRKSFTLSVEGILNLGHGSPALLSCGQQSVGVYLGIASSPTWFEVQLTSGAVQQWSVTHRQYAEISALSLLGKGTVFASFISTRNNKSAGLYTLVPGAGNSARWAPVGG